MPHYSIEPNERVTFATAFEDDHLLVVEKPAHVVTLPGLGHEHDSLLNGVFARHGARLQKLGKARDFGLLHRLDRETSGLVMIALRPEAYDTLRRAFEERTVTKMYWAVVASTPRSDSGVIRKPLLETPSEDRSLRKHARIGGPRAKPAVTAYRVLASSPAGAVVECRPVTGRLHQLRVHLDAIGCPIFGDDIYAPAAVRGVAPRLALHAHRLAFAHPATSERIDARSPFPKDLRRLLTRLRLPRPDLAAAEITRSDVDSLKEIQPELVGDEDAGAGGSPPATDV